MMRRIVPPTTVRAIINSTSPKSKKNRNGCVRPQIGTFLFVLFLLVAGYGSYPVQADDTAGWPDTYRGFLTRLTFPQTEWTETDLGQAVSADDRQLLAKFRPRIFIYPGEFYPLDFYAAFLPHTVVKNKKGRVEKTGPDRAYLKRIERSFGKYLDFTGDFESLTLKRDLPGDAVLYPSVYRETLVLPEREPIRIIVLKYSAVFAASGLPKKLGFFRTMFSGIMGNARIWHELDIHGAFHLLLRADTLEPLIVLLAQHNHFRTFLVGKDIAWPEDNRLAISYARRSNEPYLMPTGNAPGIFPTSGDPAHLRYILTGKRKPLTGGHDVVHGPGSGGVEIPYRLVFLTSRDPLFTSWISLGDRMKILGVFKSFYRDGPPGIYINTHPQIRKYTDTATAFYIRPEDTQALDLFEKHVQGFIEADFRPILKYNRAIIADLLNR